MARMWKRFKKYERHFLIGLVVILLATFSITGALRSCGRGAAAERDYGGSVEAAPGRRVTISDDDFRAVSARYSPFLRTTGWGPSLRYGPDMPVNPLALRDTDLKSWTHIATVEAAKAAGYGVSEEELQQGIEAFVTRAWQAEGHGVVMFSPELYDKILGIHYRGGAKADFEETVKEILLKDKFLAPLVDSMRFSKSREEAFAEWKPSRERVDLEFAAVRADQFLPAVTLEEQTRGTVAAQAEALANLVVAWRSVSTLASVAKEFQAKNKAPAKDADELVEKEKAALGSKMPDDPWKRPLVYRATAGGFTVLSAGPDGKEGTADDVGTDVVQVIDALVVVRRVAEALVDWQAKAAKWPDALEALKAAPPLPTGSKGPVPVAPLSEVPKDPWGHDLVYDPSGDPVGPVLLSLGADGARGTADDLPAVVRPGSATVPVPPRLNPWIDRAAKDAWGRPLSYVLRPGGVTAFDATSAGADGAFGTEDDVTTGNASDMAAFYNRVHGDFRVPPQREFEALWTVFPLVPDEAFAKAWGAAALKQYRPEEKECFDRWRHYTDIYYKVYSGTGADRKPVDPASPEQGHGAEDVAALKKAKAIPEAAKSWLVPAPEAFGEQKDPPKEGLPAPVTDPLFQLYVDKGWRRILLREMFFERLFNHLLATARDAHKLHVEWEKKKAGPEPAEMPFDVQLAALKDFQPGTADHEAGARFVELYRTPKPLSSKEWEEIPELADVNTSEALKPLKDGDYAILPTVIKGSVARAAFHSIKMQAERDPDLAEVRDKVMPRYLQSRAMARATEELTRVRSEAVLSKDPKQVKIVELVKAAAEKRKFAWTSGRTGPFVGAVPQQELPVPEGATPEQKAELHRTSYVRQNGYGVVKPVPSRQDVTPSTEGAVGRAVLSEEPRGDAADAPPATAYLVQVAARWDPTPEEFTGTRYAEWLRAKAYDSSALFNPTATNLRNQKGFVVEQLARFFEDWDGIKKMYDIRTRQPIEMPAVAR